ncbi:ER-golgi trafficking TRAPP I complex 85 kDa subunit-domain-containing protein [Boeremia exigua]|uniref:ER-golgi trafficking TRAPP I complex 85 kDa subunit-domain-containing protein n=1 Tax=Boeremia exigua TaxID=749465 RepID=UPI001E8D86DD|nr:ER-golgi trafficking TRAPP I complex 85 kDa subunit-domain-containing protein [Boeremia exigua]KAH6614118.1 ER-golgi trafficking TRAPP I complex 85 kDa subunit-domain-containing protein [Boeremia exigua]
MTPPQDATPKAPDFPQNVEASAGHHKHRASPASSLSSLPYRQSNPSLSKLFESTTSISTTGSRPSSGTATPTATTVPGSVFSPGSRSSGNRTPNSLPPGVSDEYRTLIQRAFVPHVAVLADAETEALVRGKGLDGGFLELLRPFGEQVPGKVTIRDSIGASKSHDDFGVRFVGVEDAYPDLRGGQRASTESTRRPRRTGGDVPQIEEVVDRHLQYSEFNHQDPNADYMNRGERIAPVEGAGSPFYTLYLRRLLSGLPIVPHETFAHPVAGIIAISSSNPHPIEELRRLYNRQHDGDLRFPQWVENDFLRYYVLVHDEENGDIAKSNQTFDSMKRHFGLHCHLLRLKSQECIPSDDDSVRLPTCEWMSAGEELAEIQKRETTDDITDPTPYFPDSDISSLRTFIRELVTQSIIPNMERSTATWNEQILSRRRGLSGRFMSLSKRWAPFGSSRNSTSASPSSNSNYDSLQGFYRPDAPEAIMRRLADYCFMLRDWKLALSTYDILRTDFQNDKAWRHYAGANEMAALSALMAPTPMSSKNRSENVDTWIEAASYSYTDRQRSAAPYYALRTLALSTELLRLRGSSAADDAARWGTRILEAGLVGNIGHALVTERISACYSIRTGIGTYRLGNRRRKAALWAVLAAESWWRLQRSQQAEKALDNALRLYNTRAESRDGGVIRLPFEDMQRFIDELRQQILGLRLTNKGFAEGRGEEEGDEKDGGEVEEEAETLDRSPRAHRKSLSNPLQGTDVVPISPALERGEKSDPFAEGFE